MTPITPSPARGRRTHRSGLLERRGRPSARNLPQDGESSLRRASAEARSAAAPPDSDRLPVAHGRGSAVCGAPVHACGPATPLTEALVAARSRGRPRNSTVLGSQRSIEVTSVRRGRRLRQSPEARIRKRRIVERPRLFALLDESKARVRMLIAPAGYGKTTLAEQWVARDDRGRLVHGPSSSTDVAALALGIARSATAIIDDCDHRCARHLGRSPRPPRTSRRSRRSSARTRCLAWRRVARPRRLPRGRAGAAKPRTFIERPRRAVARSVSDLRVVCVRAGWRRRNIMYGAVLEVYVSPHSLWTTTEAVERPGRPDGARRFRPCLHLLTDGLRSSDSQARRRPTSRDYGEQVPEMLFVQVLR